MTANHRDGFVPPQQIDQSLSVHLRELDNIDPLLPLDRADSSGHQAAVHEVSQRAKVSTEDRNASPPARFTECSNTPYDDRAAGATVRRRALTCGNHNDAVAHRGVGVRQM